MTTRTHDPIRVVVVEDSLGTNRPRAHTRNRRRHRRRRRGGRRGRGRRTRRRAPSRRRHARPSDPRRWRPTRYSNRSWDTPRLRSWSCPRRRRAASRDRPWRRWSPVRLTPFRKPEALDDLRGGDGAATRACIARCHRPASPPWTPRPSQPSCRAASGSRVRCSVAGRTACRRDRGVHRWAPGPRRGAFGFGRAPRPGPRGPAPPRRLRRGPRLMDGSESPAFRCDW